MLFFKKRFGEFLHKMFLLFFNNTYLIIIPFSTEKLSVGNPKIFQSRILTGSPRICVGDTVSEHGTPVSLQTVVHSVVCSCGRGRRKIISILIVDRVCQHIPNIHKINFGYKKLLIQFNYFIINNNLILCKSDFQCSFQN